MATSLDSALRERVKAFITELTGLVRQAAMASVQAALGGTAAPARRGRGRPKGSGAKATTAAAPKRRGRPGRMSPADVEAGANRVLEYVRGNEGQRLDQIAKALGTTTADLKRPVAALLDAKSVRREGQRRGTTYHVGGGRGGAGKARASNKRGRKGKRKAA